MKGETWNESVLIEDGLTLRRVRRVTTQGQYNNTSTYHTGRSWTADGKDLVFVSARQGRSAVFKCHAPTGDITCLIEPVNGVGGLVDLHGGPTNTIVGNGRGVSRNISVAGRTRWAVYQVENTLRAVHLDTLAERTLFEETDPNWLLHVHGIDPENKYVLIYRDPAHPQFVAGKRVTKSRAECLGDFTTQILAVPLDGGKPELVWEEHNGSCGHIQVCPTDSDLILFNREPKGMQYEEYATRSYVLRRSTGKVTPIPPRHPSKYQQHLCWSWCGRYVYYHGKVDNRLMSKGWYVGAVKPDGEVHREYVFPGAVFYGHVSAMAGRDAIVLDGNITEGLLWWLDYADPVRPRFELIARHDTDMTALPGQEAHPHAQTSPDGRYISFNWATRRGKERGRTNVFLIEV